MTAEPLKGDAVPNDTPLDSAEKAALGAWLDILIPPGHDGTRPAGSAVGFDEYVESHHLAGTVRQGLVVLEAHARAANQRPFADHDVAAQSVFVATLERSHAVYFRTLLQQVVLCYYQDPRTLRAVSADARPPFPDGFAVAEGDLSLLESVFERGPIFR